jgi:hypothetical protein
MLGVRRGSYLDPDVEPLVLRLAHEGVPAAERVLRTVRIV